MRTLCMPLPAHYCTVAGSPDEGGVDLHQHRVPRGFPQGQRHLLHHRCRRRSHGRQGCAPQEQGKVCLRVSRSRLFCCIGFGGGILRAHKAGSSACRLGFAGNGWGAGVAARGGLRRQSASPSPRTRMRVGSPFFHTRKTNSAFFRDSCLQISPRGM